VLSDFIFIFSPEKKENLQLHTLHSWEMEMEMKNLWSDGKQFGHRKLIIIYDYKASCPQLPVMLKYIRENRRSAEVPPKTKGTKVS